MITPGIMQNMIRADRVDKKARSLYLHRVNPNPSPYTNLLSDTIKPTEQDYADANKWFDDLGEAGYVSPVRAESSALMDRMLGFGSPY